MRSLVLSLALFATTFTVASGAPPTVADFKITHEPTYTGQPRYALLVFGAEATSAVWIVEDGQTLLIDRNGNGDLTDDGSPVAASDERQLLSTTGPYRDWNYQPGGIVLPDGPRLTEFRLARWQQADAKVDYGLSLTLDGKIPMYAGWFSQLGTSPQTAPVHHFGRSVAPQPLRNRELRIGDAPSRFSIAFTTPRDPTTHTEVRLSIDALPKLESPVVRIDWPVAEGAEPKRTTHELPQRCCYWEFYTTTLRVPDNLVPGMATVTVEVPPSFPLPLLSQEFQMPVVAAME